jgi:hypothetical protein
MSTLKYLLLWIACLGVTFAAVVMNISLETVTIAAPSAETTPEAAVPCSLTSSRPVNIRLGPGLNYAVRVGAQIGKLTPTTPVSQAIGTDGFTWYKLWYFNAWVRSDVVDAVGDCASVPVQTTLPPPP